MKFGHEYEASLQHNHFPAHWIKSAISYRQLKKCIKNVQLELSAMGLDRETISQLCQTRTDTPGPITSGRLRYTFNGNHFQPRLVFLVDTGLPFDVTLAPQIKHFLQSLVDQLRLSKDDGKYIEPGEMKELPEFANIPTPRFKKIEISLRSDSEFFKLLGFELSGLDNLQSKEETEMNQVISKLGEVVSQVAGPHEGSAKTDLDTWREIFRLYIESQIFFSTNEQDRHKRNASRTQKQLQVFCDNLQSLRLAKKFKRINSRATLDRFLHINYLLLKHMKFKELNVMAMTKILKKFDKRTALSARRTFPRIVAIASFSKSSPVRSVCFQISEKFLVVVPQLNDYLCPVCFSISYKPIRLRCGHVFCIRCLVVMQKSIEEHCPLCRDPVIMQADSTNIDPALTEFFQRYFPTETKAKQKENERYATIDRFGDGRGRCQVM